MAFDKFLMGLLVFSVFLISGIFLIGDFNNNYAYDGIDISTAKLDNISDGINPINQMYNISVDAQGKSLEDSSNPDDVEQSMFRSALRTVKVIGLTPVFVGKTISLIGAELGLQEEFVGVALAALAIFIASTVLLIVLRIRG